MKKINQITISLIASLCVSSGVHAGTRSMAMGDIGVATASYLTAPLSNPAMLANYDGERDNFGMLLPFIGGASDGYLDHMDREDKLWDTSRQIARLGQNNVPAHLQRDWKNALEDYQGSFGVADVQAAFALAIPNKYMSANLFASADSTVFSFAHVADSDFDLDFNIDRLEDIASTYNELVFTKFDIGFAMASKQDFEWDFHEMSWSFGITPKYQILHADFESARMTGMYDHQGLTSSSDAASANVDIGVTFNPTKSLTIGFVGRDLVAQSVSIQARDMAGVERDITLLVEPQYQLGMGYQAGSFTLGLDIDLNARQYIEDYDYERQFVKVGAEMDMWRWIQFRTGYQHSLSKHHDDILSAGFGFTPFGRFGADVAMTFGDDYVGASAQFKLTF
ncbi:conjugal transfer protein TraF [Vibrio agarivorans]|uniref:conjugal transfer protein TraF n=1 Tax=Vibrio agarivorans TaxID=153622 RepID=UPI00222E4F2B|nr:conjugal transfer protein TraF [Vibrio agarivorans]